MIGVEAFQASFTGYWVNPYTFRWQEFFLSILVFFSFLTCVLIKSQIYCLINTCSSVPKVEGDVLTGKHPWLCTESELPLVSRKARKEQSFCAGQLLCESYPKGHFLSVALPSANSQWPNPAVKVLLWFKHSCSGQPLALVFLWILFCNQTC